MAFNKEQKKAWQAANAEKIAERRKAYYAANPRRQAERMKAYYAAYVEKMADAYVASILGVPIAECPPELLELKREQLVLHRITKKLKSST